jgi:signal transduction histidine kinase
MIELKKENNELCDRLAQPPRYLLEFEKETKRLKPSEATTGEGVRAAPRLQAEVELRFGVLPNFFRLAPESPEITANLWGFARLTYLDNPLPSLFKERLFVYLSRFCEVRYCIVRHLGFLVGLGRPSGDDRSPVQTVEQVLPLLRRTLRRGKQADPHVARCAALDAPLAALPPPDSDMEEAIFTCAAHTFLQTPDAPRCLIALKRALGEVRFEHLMVFLAFVQTAHYWTKVHPELKLEEDVEQLLATREALAQCLLKDPEADACQISQELLDELETRNQELKNRVAERTAELVHEINKREKLQAQLLQAQKMESIGVLAGGIAHDFNNLLNIIQGYAALWSDGDGDRAQTAESLTIINETIQRASDVVQQLLRLVRKTESRLEPISVNHLLDGLVKLLKEAFPKTIELKTEQAAELPAVLADSNQVTQALLNLCLNARDAMLSGGTLTLTTRLVDGAELKNSGGEKPGRYVRIEVKDTGMGMDPAVQRRIFEPFFTTKGTGRGTGLGLSVVDGIVQTHKGFIQVSSAPMQGTTFRVYLPAAPLAKRPMESSLKEDACRKSQTNGHGTILLVEDEAKMLRLLEKILSKRGYQVLTAADGEEAIEVHRSHKDAIDIILLDLDLPKISGRDVLVKLKAENPDVKIVIASGYLEPDLRSEIEQAGLKHFIHKPYILDDVVKIVQSV